MKLNELSPALGSTHVAKRKGRGHATGNAEAAKKVGVVLAARAKAKGIEQVVFDRGGYVYHGRVAALAEGAREGGLNF